MELEGSLKAFSLPEVLQFLSMQKMSGHLHLSRSTYLIALSIKAGRIVNSSTLRRSRRLGELLVQRGLLRRRDLEEILKVQKTVESDKKLGELLIDRQLVTEEDLRQTIRLQVEEEIWDLFSWEDGDFKFEHAPEESVTDCPVQIDIEPLLLEGSRRQDEWSKIRRSIPRDSVVFGVVPLPSDYQRTLKLKPVEWKILSLINGTLSVEAVVHRSSLGRFETCHILNSFLNSQLICPVEPAQPSVERNGRTVPAVSAEVVARAQALVSVSSGDPGSGLLGGLFGSRGRLAQRPEGEAIEFVSPTSELGALLTAFVSQIVEHRDFGAKPEESRLLESLWLDVLMGFPRADLVRVVGNIVDPSYLEDYILNSNYASAVQECQEEALEALLRVLRIVFRLAAQRLGEKTAQRILQTLFDTCNARGRVRFGEPFDLAERWNRTLTVSA